MDGVFSLGNLVLLVAVAGLWALLRAAMGRRTGHEPRPTNVDAAGPAAARAAPAAAALAAPEGLDALRAHGDFDVSIFLEGARVAFAQVVEALSEGRRQDWRGLTTPEVDTALAAYKPARSAPVRVDGLEARVVRARLDSDAMARVEVAFASGQRDGDGVARKAQDSWVFARRLGSEDPNWRICAILPKVLS